MAPNLNQRVLAYGGLYESITATTSYTTLDGQIKPGKHIKTDREVAEIIEKFKVDPTRVLALIRENMFMIMEDKKLGETQKRARLEEYVEDYFRLMIFLDKSAFPSTGNHVYHGVPEYIPEGLSDMGGDPSIPASSRFGREKIKIRKEAIFDQSRRLFLDVYKSRSMDKKGIILKIADWVFSNFPYDHYNLGSSFGRDSIPLDRFKGYPRQRLAVCRHHALYTQVLNQAFGITSRLLKCEMDKVPHAANLVRLDGIWHLLDVTNSDLSQGERGLCLGPITEREVDLNGSVYIWTTRSPKRTYVTNKNMFFRLS
jgi:hypothetical protein